MNISEGVRLLIANAILNFHIFLIHPLLADNEEKGEHTMPNHLVIRLGKSLGQYLLPHTFTFKIYPLYHPLHCKSVAVHLRLAMESSILEIEH